ncbi:MAG: hypothetical protein QM449_05175, partial [Synergistota bacterium]|nr:hypothetical protein [Synergistota bacterium]
IGAIVAVVIMAALGAGMVGLLSTSALHEVRANYGERAYYLAESGFRYALSTHRRGGTPELLNLHGQTISMPGGGEVEFEVDIQTINSANFGDHGYTDFLVIMDGGIDPEDNKAKYGNINKFDKLRVKIPDDTKLPRYRGSIMIDGFPNPVTYQRLSGPSDDGLYTLHRITFEEGPPPNEWPNIPDTPAELPPHAQGLEGHKYATLKLPFTESVIIAKGTFGTDSLFSTSRSVKYTWVLGGTGATLPDMGPGAPEPDIFISEHEPEKRDEETQWGEQPFLVIDNPEPTYQDPDSPENPYGGGSPLMPVVQLCIDPDVFGSAFIKDWLSKLICEYDVQVKQKWGWAEVYGATGISFRWHPVGGGKYAGYGVSFMRYRGNAYEDVFGDFGDYMANSMKPHPAAYDSLRDTWFDRSNRDYGTYIGVDRQNVHKNLHTLVVLWEQYVEGGHEKRRWLAYKDLGIVGLVGDNFEKRRLDWFTRPRGLVVGNYKYDEYALGLQPDWDFDGVYLNDLNTLSVRVEEYLEDGVRKNRVKVSYGDASTYYTERIPNIIPYDNEEKRERYLPSGLLLDEDNDHYTGIWPVWSPEALADWTVEDDLFTFLGETDGNQYLKWDGINPNATGISWEEPDSLVLTRFTSPTDESGWNDRCEICLHALGLFGHREDGLSPNEDNEYAAFTDFAIRLLHSYATDEPEFVPPIQE